MPSQDQSKEGKTYRFISDPRHKETLSGRVRAACVTCRRKKIKCDGEVPCNTCSERGLLCEGLTERKRPRTKPEARRPSDASTNLAPDSPVSTLPSPRVESSQNALLDGLVTLEEPAFNNRQRPPLHKSDTVDSGYSSGRQSSVQGTAYPKPEHFDPLDSRMATYDFPNDLAGSELGLQDWNFYTPQNTSNNAQRTSQNLGSHGPAQFPAKSRDWSEPENTDLPWWSGSTVSRPSPASLISAAKVLEDQAQSLRNLASQHHAGMMDPNRRQTIALPVSPDSGFPTVDLQSSVGGPVDDMALLFATRTPPASGLQRNLDLGWYHAQADNYNPFSNHQLPALQSQAPQLDNTTIAEFGDTDWNLASRRNHTANERPLVGLNQEQLVLERNRFGNAHGMRSTMMEQPDCTFTWPER